MNTKAVRIYGANDLRLEEFALPPLKDDEVLCRVISDSLCMSSHKLSVLGNAHKRVRGDLTTHPAIIGHECCGIIEQVGTKWRKQFKAGDKFAVQPAIITTNPDGTQNHWAIGYSYEYAGGNATYIILPNEVMENNCLLKSEGDNFYSGSLAEPVSCIIGAFHAQYHTTEGSYDHRMGIKAGGSLALLAGAGPMGLEAIDYAIHNPGPRPSRIVVTDIDDARLGRAAGFLTPEDAVKYGVTLMYVNTKDMADPAARLRALSDKDSGFDDVFVFAPVPPLIELGDKLLGHDGCLNFFSGPTDTGLAARLNFYQVHYDSHHLVGTSGGNTADMEEALALMAAGMINPVFMVTHIGGLDAAAQATINLDKVSGAKKLIYTHKKLELTAIDEFAEKGKTSPFFAKLAEICAAHHHLWNREAENYLLENAPDI